MSPAAAHQENGYYCRLAGTGWWCSRCYDLYGKRRTFRTYYGFRMHVEQQHEQRPRWGRYWDNRITQALRAHLSVMLRGWRTIKSAGEELADVFATLELEGAADTDDRVDALAWAVKALAKFDEGRTVEAPGSE